MIAYFWKEKGDPERYVGFDRERLAKLDPPFYFAWVQYQVAKAAVDAMAENIATANDPDR